MKHWLVSSVLSIDGSKLRLGTRRSGGSVAFNLRITFSGCILFAFGDATRLPWTRPKVSRLRFPSCLPEDPDTCYGLCKMLYEERSDSSVREALAAATIPWDDRGPETAPQRCTRPSGGPGRSFRLSVSPHLKILLPVGC